MIITEQKPIKEILEALKDYHKIFLVGCGECAAFIALADYYLYP